MSGLDVLHAIQSISHPVLDSFFIFITDLHQVNFYVLMFPLLTWYYDKTFARYLVSVFLVGFWANNVLKFYFNTPRPSPEDVRVLHPESGTGPAFPSGHSQNPLMFFGALAQRIGIPWVTLLLAILVLLIGFSRLYLGLHWPQDVLGGWLIGFIMLYGFELSRGFWLGKGMSLWQQLGVAVAVPLGMLLVWQSAPWNTPSGLAGDSWMLAGAYLGFWIGSILEEEFVGFEPRRGDWKVHLMKALIGLALVFGVKEGLKLVLPRVAWGDLLRYFAVGLAATFVAPLLFRRLDTAPPISRSLSR